MNCDKYRETALPADLTTTITTLADLRDADDSTSLVVVSTRTVERWVDRVAEELADEYDDGWRYLTPHALRRTWGTLLCEREPVSIDAAEEYIDNVDVQGRYGFEGDVFSVEPLIYYDELDESYVSRCRTEWDNCREQLEQLESVCPVLGREGDRHLQLMAGEFDSDELQQWMEEGIEMAETPRVTVTMTDGLEIESIAVTLCRIWGERAVSDPVTVGVSEMRSHFNYRDLEPQRVQSAFDLLHELDAASRDGPRKIEFTPDKMPQLLNIETLVGERSGGEDQEGLDEFF